MTQTADFRDEFVGIRLAQLTTRAGKERWKQANRRIGCSILCVLPIIGFGLFLLFAIVGEFQALRHHASWAAIAALLALLVGFGVVGGLGLVRLFRLRSQTRIAVVRFEQFPDQPWMWEEVDSPSQYLPHCTWVRPVVGSLVGMLLWGVTIPLLFNPALLMRVPLAACLVLILFVGVSQTYQAIRSIRRRLRQGVPRLTVTPWPLRVGSRVRLEISIEHVLPVGTELSVLLEVVMMTMPDDEPRRVVSVTTKAPVPQRRGSWGCEIDLPTGVPRSLGLLDDEYGFKQGVWTLHITQPGDKWGFDAKYTLRVY